jgi:hypothetical protein
LRTQTDQHSSVQGIWAITWRSVVYLPAMLGMFLFLLLLATALVALPFFGALFVACGFWWQGIAAFLSWVALVAAWRRFCIGRFFEAPPSLL